MAYDILNGSIVDWRARFFQGARIDVGLLGPNISFDPGGDDDMVGGFAGINMFSQVTGDIQLFGNAGVRMRFQDGMA